MKNLKELIILHSNDMHGDFLAEQIDEKLVGGVSLLSGYVNMVRNQEKNVLYAIAGDMFRGSVIDSEYKGVSTIGIMNLLGPDVATIGNHEVDYGLAHLLFLEKCANFPIINANFHIRSNHKRLFQPHYIAEIDTYYWNNNRGCTCTDKSIRTEWFLSGYQQSSTGSRQYMQCLQCH